MMDQYAWGLPSPMTPMTPMTPHDMPLTPMAPLSSAGSPVKMEWPGSFAVGPVGGLDFALYDSRDCAPTVQTIYPSAGTAGVIKGQLCGLDEADPALGPLERLQRKWGIGDRKTRDGAPAKRRGPKPDSKPAMTRRQELNRQAQRTHRERKENYMRELEIAVDRLKKTYEEDVVRVREENKKLKALLAAHNIQHEFIGSQQSSTSPISAIAAPSAGSVYGSHSGFTSPTNTNMPVMSMPSASPSYQQLNYPTSGSLPVPRSNIHGLDYDDIAMDFVGQYGRTPYLSPPPNQLESNCRDHQQYMVNRSLTNEDWICGHALMATVPPRQHCAEHGMDVQYPHQMPDLPKPDLVRMLNLSAQLPGLADELTPVMAWALILNQTDCSEFTQADFNAIKEDLAPKVACYGFGAVLEEFEVKDAIHKVVATKSPQATGEMDWDTLSPSAQ